MAGDGCKTLQNKASRVVSSDHVLVDTCMILR
jgi:hypothetical protein